MCLSGKGIARLVFVLSTITKNHWWWWWSLNKRWCAFKPDPPIHLLVAVAHKGPHWRWWWWRGGGGYFFISRFLGAALIYHIHPVGWLLAVLPPWCYCWCLGTRITLLWRGRGWPSQGQLVLVIVMTPGQVWGGRWPQGGISRNPGSPKFHRDNTLAAWVCLQCVKRTYTYLFYSYSSSHAPPGSL